jgi:hypothetical protein
MMREVLAETNIPKTPRRYPMNAFSHIPLDPTDIYAKRNRGHHNGFCDFLGQEADQVNAELAKAETIIAEIDRLSEAGIVLSHRNREDYLAANADANALRCKLSRIEAAVCYANEYMNV